jgi:PKD repeat protein
MMPDGSIVLIGGQDSVGLKNDVWRLMPVGSSVQNPSHTYTTSGIYKVTLQVYNAGGRNSIRKPGYITVTTTNQSTPTPTPTIQAEGSTTTIINANVQQQLSVALTNPFTGNWALSQGANSQNYGSLTITANVPWSESTSSTNGDYLKNSGGVPLTNKIQMNAADVTAYTTSGTGSSSTPLNFAQQVVMADPAGSYGTVVTFTVNAV